MTGDMITVFIILIITIILFVTDRIRVDVIALLVLLSLAWTKILTPAEAFSGLSSNAVLAMIAVMVMGRGIAKTGIMNRFSDIIVSHTSGSENKIRSVIGLSVGTFSAFMQNIGAVALFLPALIGVSKKAKISLSRLIMPLGFAAILGGTLTMIASGPLILLNDLMIQNGLEKFPLFYVTPIGLILLVLGLLYFNTFGKKLLPADNDGGGMDFQRQLIDKWRLPSSIVKCRINKGSPLAGMHRDDINTAKKYGVYILAIGREDEIIYAPWRYTVFEEEMRLCILYTDNEHLQAFADEFNLSIEENVDRFEDLKRSGSAGFAEIIIPPRSHIKGSTIRDIALRKNFNVEPVMLIQGNMEFKSDFSDAPLRTGSTLIVYGKWQHISVLEKTNDFVVLTQYQREDLRPGKSWLALLCFAAAIVLALFGVKLSLALLTGAVAMVILRVISIDELYNAIDWKTVFLIAGLIPLGLAMEKTGAAAYIARHLMTVLQDAHILVLLGAIGVLTTVFTLFMSNVAATVLLVPLVISLAPLIGADGRILSLFVAVCTANSFILPTHQVNAFLLSVGGYKNRDYMKAGGIMTIIFIIIAVLGIYFLYM